MTEYFKSILLLCETNRAKPQRVKSETCGNADGAHIRIMCSVYRYAHLNIYRRVVFLYNFFLYKTMPEQITSLVYKFDTDFFLFDHFRVYAKRNSQRFICRVGKGSSIGRG